MKIKIQLLIVFFLSLNLSYGFRLLDPNDMNDRYGKSSEPPFAKFVNSNYTYFITMGLVNWDSEIASAFNTWNNVSNVNFSYGTSGLPLVSDDFGMGNPAATSWSHDNYQRGDFSSEYIVMNEAYGWYNNGRHKISDGDFDFEHVFLHEVGHVLGLAHPQTGSYTEDATAPIMAGSDNDYFDENIAHTLRNDDIAGIDWIDSHAMVPEHYSTVNTAFNNISSNGEVFISSDNFTLQNDEIISSNQTLTITSGAVLNLGLNKITVNGGSVNLESGATINPKIVRKSGSTVKGYHPSIKDAVNNASAGETIEIYDTHTIVDNILIMREMTLKFASGEGLIITGRINASVSSTDRIVFTSISGSWDGITLNNVGNITSLEHCEVKNATNGITVSNCEPQIKGCYIHDNSNHGIYIINGASPELQYNTIKNNGGSGIYNNGGTSETYCEISGTGKNDIMNNSGAGVYNNGGFVHLGPYMGAGASYYNTVSGNSGEIYNSSGAVEAQKCYWGTSNPTYQLFLGSGITDWQNYLSSDQADGSPLAKNAGQNWEDIENNFDRNNPEELYILANYLREQSRSDEAGSVYKDIIIRFPNSSVVKNSVRKLFLTERKLDKKYILDYVKSLRNGKTLSHIDNALCEILLLEYVRQNDVNNVEKLGKEIIKNYSNSDSEKMALYNLSTYQEMGANNRIKYLDIIKAKYPNDPLTLHAMVLNGEEVDWTKQVDRLEKSISDNNETVVADFSLNPTYPNPFNPSTTIPFSLSRQSKIDIRIYNLKGKEVWIWGNNLEYGIGNHKVVWNAIDASGNPLSSGVYFIKLIAGEQVATQKVILMK